MRDVPEIWAAWNSGVYVGETRPSTRLTVEQGWELHTSVPVLGTWNRGPARWYQAEDAALRLEIEVPNVTSVNMSRSVDNDANTCDITLTNTPPPIYGEPETPAGQFGQPGYYTWDRGSSQDARARWGHVANAWNEVLVPNALLRTYQGFGGQDKTIPEAVADGNIVLNGVWLVDDVSVSTDGSLALKCRDMGKLVVDQQLFPPLVPQTLYPLDYRRWIFKYFVIPDSNVGVPGDQCFQGHYLASSTDDYYGQFNSPATGHPGSDAFDMSFETGPDTPGSYAHQRTYWMSEPMDSPNDSVWIEFSVDADNGGEINQIYYHAWKGAIEGRGIHRVMVSVFEHGQWVPGSSNLGGVTPQGLPYVCIITPGSEPAGVVQTQLHNLPRDYRATKIRLTVTSLIWAVDFPRGYDDDDPRGPGYRGGARKIMACFSRTNGAVRFPTFVYAAAAIPKNGDSRLGYWQVRANGQVFAFGDARTYDANSPASSPASTVIGMSAHPDGLGYWLVDVTGRVISAGSAQHHGDQGDNGRTDIVDIAPAPDGNGYWLLALDGSVFQYGSAVDHGDSVYSATMANGTPAWARAIESHPSIQGYWVLWSNGAITAHNLTHHGNGFDHTGWTLDEYAPCLRRTSTGNGYWIMSGSGKIQAKGDAPHKGDANLTGYDQNWFLGLCYDIVTTADSDDGYAIQSADGRLWAHGNSIGLSYGNIGSGKGQTRSDGNYKDYSDIIRDLLLWAGFYFYVNPQPAAARPNVYGNIETTGAWAEDPLPRAMFDKKPIADSIKEIKEIVGYLAYVDSEGGFRFELPNLFAMGNFLADGTPYNHMPEIDESVQLLSHQVTRSAADARSRLIITTEDPEPQTAGQPVLTKGIVTTEIEPLTKRDLRGLVVPAMWINGKFLRKEEQKVMADLVDMRMWFARRVGNISCVANPLIDINDQVRVLERQTGEVYVHYIRGVSISHDLTSGEFTMDLNTHWLGGTPYGKSNYFYSAAGLPAGGGYWQATIGGQVRAHGDAEIYDRHEADTHLEWVVGFRSTRTGLGYLTLDTTGKILTYGDAVHHGELQRSQKDVIDFALTPSGAGYWVLQTDGTVTAFGDATHFGDAELPAILTAQSVSAAPTVKATSIESHPSTPGYWVLLSDGEVQEFNLPNYGSASLVGYAPREITACLRATVTGGGYFIPSQSGTSVQWFGDAVHHGAGVPRPDGLSPDSIVWDMIVAPDGGYALQRADGVLEAKAFTTLSGSGEHPLTVQWAVVSPEAHAEMDDKSQAFGVSEELMAFLAKTGSPGANNAVVNNFGAPAEVVP